MKTLEKIKLNQLRKAELEKREMNALVGGSGNCSYWCGYYHDPMWGVSFYDLQGDLGQKYGSCG